MGVWPYPIYPYVRFRKSPDKNGFNYMGNEAEGMGQKRVVDESVIPTSVFEKNKKEGSKNLG